MCVHADSANNKNPGEAGDMAGLSGFPRLIAGIGLLLLMPLADAAQIYGTLTENGRPVAGIAITVRCKGVPDVPAETNDSGSYSVKISATGYCHLAVTNRTGNPSIEVYLYDQPSRYDLNLTRNADGSYVLSKT